MAAVNTIFIATIPHLHIESALQILTQAYDTSSKNLFAFGTSHIPSIKMLEDKKKNGEIRDIPCVVYVGDAGFNVNNKDQYILKTCKNFLCSARLIDYESADSQGKLPANLDILGIRPPSTYNDTKFIGFYILSDIQINQPIDLAVQYKLSKVKTPLRHPCFIKS